MPNDLFAPPSADELKSAQQGLRQQPSADLFAPPTKDELAQHAPQAAAPDESTPRGRIQAAADASPLSKPDLSGAARMADLPAGLIRTGIAGAAGVATSKDLANAVQGQAPKSAEYFERAGVPEGPSVTLPLVGKVTARGTAGLASDVITDPMLYAGSAMTKPLSAGAEATGESAYKSGFKKIDERLVEKGKQPLSDLLLENGAPTGTTKQIAEKTGQMADDLASQRADLYKQASDKGVTVDLGYPLPKTEALLSKMRENPGLRDMADQLEDKMLAYKKEGKVPVDKLSDWKSSFYDSLPQNAFGPDGQIRGPAKEFVRSMSDDFRQAIVDAGNKAEAGLGDKISDVNDKWSTLISAEKPTAMQIRRGETPNVVTPIDAMLSHEPGLLALKKGADIAKTTYARTNVGKGLMATGKSGLLDVAARQGLLNKRRGLVDNGASRGQMIQSRDGSND